jgi:hypothetical protein
MKNNKEKNLYSICDTIGPKDFGIFWITSENSDTKSSLYYELNYLMDGLISLGENSKSESQNLNFYLTQSFGHSYFLAQLDCNSEKELEKFKEIFNIVPNNAEHNRILVINQNKDLSEKKLVSKLTSTFKDFEFNLYRPSQSQSEN